MKKFIMITLLFAFYAVNAQQNAIKTGPIALAFGNLNVAFEHQFSEKMSVVLKAKYFMGYKINDEAYDAFGLGVGTRFYLIPKHELAGFYLHPQFNYSSMGLSNVGATIGYQWHWDNNLVLDLGIGPAKYLVIGEFSGDVPGLWPIVTGAIGYAF